MRLFHLYDLRLYDQYVILGGHSELWFGVYIKMSIVQELTYH